MTSTTESSKCGFCGSSLSKTEVALQKFDIHCSVCLIDHVVHQKCSLKLLNLHQQQCNKKITKIHGIQEHENSVELMKLFCKHCETNCFLCDKKHLCKLIIYQ